MPEGLHNFLLRLTAFFRKRRLDGEMAEELEFHHAMLREKMIREGLDPDDARLGATRRFGRSERWHERLREVWQFRALENFMRDAAFSARLLRKSPGFTLVAILTLALGIGANATIFSLINGLLLRPLPVPRGEDLVVVSISRKSNDRGPMYTYPEPYFRSMERNLDRSRNANSAFSDVFAYSGEKFQVRGVAGTEEFSGMYASGEFFSGMATAPLLGRYLTPQDDRKGGNPEGLAVVISENFWNRWFNHAPNVVGSKLIIANTAFTVVGVMPRRFIGPDPTQNPCFYIPMSSEPVLNAPDGMSGKYNAWWMSVMARRRPGVTMEAANQALAAPTVEANHDVTNTQFLEQVQTQDFHFQAEPGARGFTYIREQFTKPLEAVFAMCCGILLLACLNLASLLMARSAARERELATRLAMGATRSRLVQQLMIESLMIAVLGTAVGLLAAPAVSRSLAAMLMNGAGGNSQLDTSMDVRMFGFAALVAVVSGLVIGLAPALRATSGNLSDHIKDGSQHATRPSYRRGFLPSFPRVLMALEVSLALILVTGAGLLATSLIRLYRVGFGFDPRGVVNLALNMDKQPLQGPALLQLYREIEDRVSRQPGVRSVSYAAIIPLTHYIWDDDFSTAAGTKSNLDMNTVGPGYFQAMGISLLEGRDFTWNDTTASGLKIVLTQPAAKVLFPAGHAVGQQVMNGDKEQTAYTVIGVVNSVKYEDLRTEFSPGGYMPMTQKKKPRASYQIVVKMDEKSMPLAGAMSAAARKIVAELAPSAPAPEMTTMSGVVDDSVSSERMMAMLSVYFAVCALLVTAIGLYGTLAYSTARRTPEIGIRMALGAKRAQVVGLVFRENARVAIFGAAAGLIAALLASKALESFLYGISARDPWVLGGSVLALAAIASAASLLPALRAARIDPMAAMRCE